ncbi:uncharacterized protein LOC126265839 [Aethina tumida]|uniref:uncharacterized protein LOC126265839 n=1 Tax=Aethina tumida TaxID=116153 RepID=UPI00214947A6|nr:uncharacterized protein LOC126265839 [Aethina tumida]
MKLIFLCFIFLTFQESVFEITESGGHSKDEDVYKKLFDDEILPVFPDIPKNKHQPEYIREDLSNALHKTSSDLTISEKNLENNTLSSSPSSDAIKISSIVKTTNKMNISSPSLSSSETLMKESYSSLYTTSKSDGTNKMNISPSSSLSSETLMKESNSSLFTSLKNDATNKMSISSSSSSSSSSSETLTEESYSSLFTTSKIDVERKNNVEEETLFSSAIILTIETSTESFTVEPTVEVKEKNGINNQESSLTVTTLNRDVEGSNTIHDKAKTVTPVQNTEVKTVSRVAFTSSTETTTNKIFNEKNIKEKSTENSNMEYTKHETKATTVKSTTSKCSLSEEDKKLPVISNEENLDLKDLEKNPDKNVCEMIDELSKKPKQRHIYEKTQRPKRRINRKSNFRLTKGHPIRKRKMLRET